MNSASELKFTALVFRKKRKKTINCTGFSREKKLFTLINCRAPLFNGSSPREAAKCCFYKTCGTAEFLMGPTSIKLCFFFNQTFIYVAAGEPHLQPHYQTTSLPFVTTWVITIKPWQSIQVRLIYPIIYIKFKVVSLFNCYFLSFLCPTKQDKITTNYLSNEPSFCFFEVLIVKVSLDHFLLWMETGFFFSDGVLNRFRLDLVWSK